jgi:predicted nucleic acid-binding protein
VLILADSNVLLRFLESTAPEYEMLRGVVDALIDRGELPCFVPQNVVESWNVCTRPLRNNGFGLTPAEATARLTRLERKFFFLPDNDRIHEIWKALVLKHSVRGAQVHDARLVAAMMSHGVQRLLTFNGKDFRRYGIDVVEPQQVGE